MKHGKLEDYDSSDLPYDIGFFLWDYHTSWFPNHYWGGIKKQDVYHGIFVGDVIFGFNRDEKTIS